MGYLYRVTSNMYCGDSSIVAEAQRAEDDIIEQWLANSFRRKDPLYNPYSYFTLIEDTQGQWFND